MGFFNKLRKKVRNKIVSPELAPFNRGRSVLTGLRNTNRRNIGSGVKFGPPQKAPELGGLADLYRRLNTQLQDRLQKQLRNQQMRMPQPIPERMPASSFKPEGMSDRFAQQLIDKGIDLADENYLYQPRFNLASGSTERFIPMPKPVGPNPDYVPPAVAPDIIPNLDLGMPIMPEERMAPPVMNQMQGQPRMMMSAGRDANMVDFLNSDPQQQIFGIETKIGILENKLQEALANNDRQSYDMIVDQINDADAQIIDIKNSINPLRTSGRPEMVGPKFDGFEEFITSIGPQNYGDYVGEPTLDDILSETIPAPISYREILGESGRTLSNRDLERLKPRDIRDMLGESGRTISNMDRDYLDDILSDLEKKN